MTAALITEINIHNAEKKSPMFSGALRDRLAELSGTPVGIGPVEATAVGNVLTQGVALGVYADLADGRRHLGSGEP